MSILSGHLLIKIMLNYHFLLICLGGVSGIVTKSGGGAGLSGLFTNRVKDRKGGILATWFLGLMIFLDDYANTLLVGASMRPITDNQMSREKTCFFSRCYGSSCGKYCTYIFLGWCRGCLYSRTTYCAWCRKRRLSYVP